MSGGAPLVVCRGVGRTYVSGRDAFVALRDATCEVLPGDRVALVGASGSGKSTLLHLLAELDRPSAGTVQWPGLADHPRALPAGTVAFVFQGPSLIPTLDAAENVMLPLVLGGVPAADARHRATAALARVGLVEVAAHLPEELSGGQAQRVAVARALAGEPRVVFADEPTGQLDHPTAEGVLDALLGSLTDDAALVVATHDPAVAGRMESRWQLTEGRLDTGVLTCSR